MARLGKNSIRGKLRALPIDQRAQLIIEMFSVIAAEFAAMVLEHAKPEKPKRRKRSK